MIIYKSTNKLNGLSYIGQTIQKLKTRKKKHLNGKETYFSNSLKKYGDENFEWEILEECNSKEELDEREKYYISELDTLRPNGYNLTLGGDGGTLGYKHTEETKKKMRKPKSKEHRAKMSEIAKNRIISKETIEKFKIINSGKRNGMYGKQHSEETKKKISEKAKLRCGEKNSNFGKTGKKSKLFNKSRTDYVWKIIYPEGTKTLINRVSKFCRDYFEETGIKLHVSNFYKLRNGEIKTYKGFKLYV